MTRFTLRLAGGKAPEPAPKSTPRALTERTVSIRWCDANKHKAIIAIGLDANDAEDLARVMIDVTGKPDQVQAVAEALVERWNAGATP